jgi:hypothetical protein
MVTEAYSVVKSGEMGDIHHVQLSAVVYDKNLSLAEHERAT